MNKQFSFSDKNKASKMFNIMSKNIETIFRRNHRHRRLHRIYDRFFFVAAPRCARA